MPFHMYQHNRCARPKQSCGHNPYLYARCGHCSIPLEEKRGKQNLLYHPFLHKCPTKMWILFHCCNAVCFILKERGLRAFLAKHFSQILHQRVPNKKGSSAILCLWLWLFFITVKLYWNQKELPQEVKPKTEHNHNIQERKTIEIRTKLMSTPFSSNCLWHFRCVKLQASVVCNILHM